MKTPASTTPEHDGPTPIATPTAPPLSRILLALAALCLLLGFVLPWLRLGPARISGLSLVLGEDTLETGLEGGWIVRALVLLPLLGLVWLALAARGTPWLRGVARWSAVALLLLALFAVLIIFVRVTAYGLWLALLGPCLALAAGFSKRASSGRRP
ncbi:MAG: hypothetical protein ACPGUV_09995 [Polyangiales bacterium]